MKDFFGTASSDNFRFARSKYVLNPDDDVYGLIRLPRYSFVVDVFFRLITAYTVGSTGSISVGIFGNKVLTEDAVLASAYINPDEAGMSRMSSGNSYAAEGYWFEDGSGAITATFDIGDSSINCACQVFALYSVLH